MFSEHEVAKYWVGKPYLGFLIISFTLFHHFGKRLATYNSDIRGLIVRKMYVFWFL